MLTVASTHTHTHDDVLSLRTIHYYSNRNDKQQLRGSHYTTCQTEPYKPLNRQKISTNAVALTS